MELCLQFERTGGGKVKWKWKKGGEKKRREKKR